MCNKSSVTHLMNLNSEPFEAIRCGSKTVEMRLNDEKRQLICRGDFIRFTNTETGEELTVKVLDRLVYPSFTELYSEHDKISIGYKENEVADPSDMLEYYPKERVEK
ncbi:MAG: ASCH domain-containing protein [Clostridia bacterium]|nr:ASCH domain-containing protein [Clostridia bacterium]